MACIRSFCNTTSSTSRERATHTASPGNPARMRRRDSTIRSVTNNCPLRFGFQFSNGREEENEEKPLSDLNLAGVLNYFSLTEFSFSKTENLKIVHIPNKVIDKSDRHKFTIRITNCLRLKIFHTYFVSNKIKGLKTDRDIV